MYYSDFPIINDEAKLPLYVDNIGVNKREYHIIRKDGFAHPLFIYCTKGSGMLIIQGERYKIVENMGFYIPKGLAHEYYPEEDIWETHWVVPEGFAVNDVLLQFGFSTMTLFQIKDAKLLDHHMTKMHNAFIGDKLFGNYKAAGYLYDFLIELYRQTSVHGSQKSTNAIVMKAVDYINHNYKKQISLEELCEVCGVSKQHLCRLFQGVLCTRPMEYIAKTRISASKEFLAKSRLPIDYIAEKCGFCSGSYFTKLFKRYEGMTPTQFRNG